MLSFVGFRFAAFERSITSHEVHQMHLIDSFIVRLPPTPLAICPAPSPRSSNPTLAPSPSACLSAPSPPPLAIALDPSLPSSNPTIAPSPSAYPRDSSPLPRPIASSPSACLCAPSPPICISVSFSLPLGACLCASELTTITPLPTPTEADFDIFPKLRHEELTKPIRRYGAGIVAVGHKAEFVKVDDVDSPPGRECSFLDDYIPERNAGKEGPDHKLT